MFNTLNKYGLSDLHIGHDKESGLKAIIAIHDTTLGPALGGCRFMEYPSEEDAIADAANLAKGMTYKAALANLPLGGGKSVILKPTEPFDRELLFSRFGDFINSLSGRYITALDCGTTMDDMDIIASRTDYVASTHKLGDCSERTALGVYNSMGAALEHLFHNPNFTGIRVAIQGLGHVGMSLAELLHQAGAELIVCDLDQERVERAQQQFNALAVSPNEIHKQCCEIFSPCGLGGSINDQTIDQLQCLIIAGAANNQLAEDRLAEVLNLRGIIYIPDFAINSGGLIYAGLKYQNASDSGIATRLAMVHKTVSELLQQSEAKANTPLQGAFTIAEQRIQQAKINLEANSPDIALSKPKATCSEERKEKVGLASSLAY